MTRLIDADALKAVFEENSIEAVCGVELCKAIISRIDNAPTVNAVPVSYIQQRIDRLKILAEYEAEANGGYVGKVHTEVYALRALINYWKGEQSAKDK